MKIISTEGCHKSQVDLPVQARCVHMYEYMVTMVFAWHFLLALTKLSSDGKIKIAFHVRFSVQMK